MTESSRARDLRTDIADRPPEEAAERIASESPAAAARVLEHSNPARAVAVLGNMPEIARRAVLEAATPEWADQWRHNGEYAEDTVGRMMAPAFAVLPPHAKVADAVDLMREIIKKALVSYVFVTDAERKLRGVLVFRDLLVAAPEQPVADVMIRDPFFLPADLSVVKAMRAVVTRHHPSYPVCDQAGRLVGVMRGETLFQHQAFELSAQAGSMVGIQKEERLVTHWRQSLRMRHPWLQLNLATAFLAAAVVGYFQEIIDRLVVLAVFLPVLAGQAGNTGAQTLAVTLRGATLGDLRNTRFAKLLLKEAWLGLVNGMLVGVTAGAAMLAYAHYLRLPDAASLALIVLLAMTGSCVAGGVSGVVVPLALRRLGADPATASSIFLTTATDCVSMGALLALATRLVP